MKDPIKHRFQQKIEEISLHFGKLIRTHRKDLGMTQEELALASGVSRKFVIELESGRPTCELGRSLIVASVVGLRPIDPIGSDNDSSQLLPDLLDVGLEE